MAESAESRALANGDEWFYGELEFDAARALLRRCAPNGESGEFVDLGSGLGKMVVAAALSGRFSRARGVELLRELHVEATEGLRAYERALEEEVGGSCRGDDDGGDEKDLATARRHGAVQLLRALTCDAYLSAASLTSSRAFFVDEWHEEALVPFADLLNHKSALVPEGAEIEGGCADEGEDEGSHGRQGGHGAQRPEDTDEAEGGECWHPGHV